VGVHFAALSRWQDRERDLLAGAGLELGLRGIPVFFLVSAGMIDGEVGLDFAGIGTGLGIARKALRERHGGED
jgi:hypothetical protein